MRKLIIALAFGALFLPNLGLTLGLGEIEVDTALNQELDAEIELLSATPEETETLIVQLASREEFLRAGLDRPYLLNSLKFSTITRDGRPYIKITTDKPIREPYLNFLVEVDWPKGHLLREYTILLDPPVFMGAESAPAARPAASDRTDESESRPQPRSQAQPSTGGSFRPAAAGAVSAGSSAATTTGAADDTSSRYQPAPVVTVGDYGSSGKYRIRSGDTLWSLAQNMRPDSSISIEQMMLAMLKTNPEAFINENVNGLKRGYILRMPDRQMIDSMTQAEAVAMVRQQNALWREYQQALASGRPASAMPGESEGAGMDMQSARDSRLEIVSAGTGVSATGSKDPTKMTASELRGELALANEALESQRLQNEALQDQVGTLESRVEEMQSLLTLEDADLARMQGMPGEAGMEQPVEEAEMTETEVVMDETGEFMVIEPAEEEMESGEKMPEASTPEEEEAVFVDETMQGEQVAEQPAEEPAMDEDFTVEPPMQQEFIQPEPKGLLSSPIFLAGAGAGVLLLIVLIALIIKRRKSDEAEPEAAAAIRDETELDEIADMVDDRDAEQAIGDEEIEEHIAETGVSADTDAESFDSDSTVVLPGADDTIVTSAEEQEKEKEEPRDDIIAEADVYLAYGIYQQAEELLQNAIRENPDNDGYRVKLAETYFAAKNKDAFIELANEMNERRAGENTGAWQKIVAIGTELTPDHGLFTGAEAEMVGDVDMDDLMPKSPEPMDIDLGSDDSADAPDLDFSLDEEAESSGDTGQTTVLDSGDADESTAILDLSPDELGLDMTESGTGKAEEAGGEEEGVEFNLGEAGAAESEKTPVAKAESDEEFSLDIGAEELDIQDEGEEETRLSDEEDVEFDIEDMGEPADAAESPEEEAISIEGVDDSSLDFDIGEEEKTPSDTAGEADSGFEMPSAEEGMDFDLTEEVETAAGEQEEAAGEIELEAPSEEKPPEAEEPAQESAGERESIDDDMDLSDLDDLDEISTKLDLARAYLDMGDAEGTRSILDEVMAEGNDEQKKEAEELLRQL